VPRRGGRGQLVEFSEHVPYGSAYGLDNVAAQAALRDAAVRFKNWFTPFGSGTDRGVPHPFTLE
jgi:hypothetical protein